MDIKLSFRNATKDFSGLEIAALNDDGGTSSGVQVGVVSNAKQLYGGQIGLSNLITDEFNGIQLGLINAGGEVDYQGASKGVMIGAINIQAGRFYGAKFGILNFGDSKVYGFSVGGINGGKKHYGVRVGFENLSKDSRGLDVGIINSARDSYGLRIGLSGNASDNNTNGVDLGILNGSKNVRGVQLGALNIVLGTMHGLSAGLIGTYAKKLRGVQTSFFYNGCGPDSVGLQVGLVNRRAGDKWWKQFLPIVAVRTPIKKAAATTAKVEQAA